MKAHVLLLLLLPFSLASMQKNSEKKAKKKTALCAECTASLGNAIVKNNSEVIDEILCENIDFNTINIKDTPTNKPLHLACFDPKTIAIAELLLKKGFNMNEKDLFGDTALHWAVRQENTEATVLLIKNNAKTNITNKAGKKAFYWAQKYKHLKLKRSKL